MIRSVRTLMLIALAATLVLGCATFRERRDPAVAIEAMLADWAGSLEAHDLDGVMAHFSEDFRHYEFRDKAGVRRFLDEAVDGGYLDDAAVDLDRTVIAVEDDTATVSGADVRADFGRSALSFRLAKEDGHWRIVGLTSREY